MPTKSKTPEQIKAQKKRTRKKKAAMKNYYAQFPPCPQPLPPKPVPATEEDLQEFFGDRWNESTPRYMRD